MESNKKTLLSMAVQFVIVLAIAAAIALYEGVLDATETHQILRCLSDGFFVPAILFVGFGLMMWIAGTGFFDIFGYAFKSLFAIFTPLKKLKEHPKYYDYRCAKDEKRKEKPATNTLLVTGLIALALAMLLLVLYNLCLPVAG